jgi:hypothetical protein
VTSATVLPAQYTLVIPQSATLRERIELPFDGTGKTAVAQVWESYTATSPLFSLDVTVVDTTPLMIIELTADWEVTRTVTKNAVWDLLVINDDDTRDHWLKGRALLSERVTEVTS